MNRNTVETTLPEALIQFARSTQGDYEQRHTIVVKHAFAEYGLFLNPNQLRDLCGGGQHAVAKRVVNNFRTELHSQFVQRCSVLAISEWLERGMSDDVTMLSPKERQFAGVFKNYVARLTLRH